MNRRTNRRTNRRITGTAALALTTALTLSACGSDSGSGSESGGTDDAAERTVQTAMGKVNVPENPERVVVLDTGELDSMLTLGVKPVGAVRADVATGFLSYLPKDQLKGIANVGNIAAPNMEKVAELKPDLIISSKVRDEDRYDELSAIAPTVLTENPGYPWKENFQVHAKALGKEAEAKKVVADYDKHVKKVTEAIGGADEAKNTEVSMVRFIEGGDTRLYGKKNYIGTILTDVGLGRPAVVDKAKDGFSYDVSPEQVDQGDGDVIFYTSFGSPDKSGESKAVDGALWKSMKAVKNDRAYHVSDDLWFMGIGYTAAEKILDEIEDHLAD